jgi:hypothetical protein
VTFDTAVYANGGAQVLLDDGPATINQVAYYGIGSSGREVAAFKTSLLVSALERVGIKPVVIQSNNPRR